MPYSFPVPVPGPGIANSSPPPDGQQSDHSGQASGGTVGVTIYAGAQSGQANIPITTVMDGVTEGNEVAKLVVKDGAAENGLTITDSSYGSPPPGGGGTGGGGGGTPTNRPPVVNDASVRVDELAGRTATVTGAYSDPDGDPVTCNATGVLESETFTASNGVWTWKFSRADGPRTRSIDISVYSTGGSDTATATGTVLNVAPHELALSVAPATIDEDGTVTLKGDFKDPGADTFDVDILWADGSPVETVYLGTARYLNVTHKYRDDNPTNTRWDNYRIHATVRDDDGGQSNDATATARVNNVDPSGLTVAPTSAVIVEGDHSVVKVNDTANPFSGTGIFTGDPGTQDTWEVVVDFGDGSAPARITTRPNEPFAYSHVYAETGTYPVTILVEDDDTGQTAPETLDVKVIEVLSLSGFDLAYPGNNKTNFDKAQPTHWYVGQRDGQAGVDVELLVDYEPIFSPAQEHILWKAIGAGAAPASGNFRATADSADHKLTLTPGVRDYLIQAGFDGDGSGQLDGGEITHELNVHVVKLNSLTAMDANNANNKAVSAALPPGGIAHVIVGQSDGGGPALIDFTGLGSSAGDLKYRLSIQEGASRVKLWADPRKEAAFTTGAVQAIPASPQLTVWAEGIALSNASGDVWLRKELIQLPANAEAVIVAADVVRMTVMNVDLDVDSDNNNGFAGPDGSADEDAAEEDVSKTVFVNHNDDDGNDVPDFADLAGSVKAEDLSVVPALLKMPQYIDWSSALFRFEYNGEPTLPNESPVPLGDELYDYSGLQKGMFRLFTLDGRFIEPHEDYTGSALGFEAGAQWLLVEAVNEGTSALKVVVNLGAAAFADLVMVQAVAGDLGVNNSTDPKAPGAKAGVPDAQFVIDGHDDKVEDQHGGFPFWWAHENDQTGRLAVAGDNQVDVEEIVDLAPVRVTVPAIPNREYALKAEPVLDESNGTLHNFYVYDAAGQDLLAHLKSAAGTDAQLALNGGEPLIDAGDADEEGADEIHPDAGTSHTYLFRATGTGTVTVKLKLLSRDGGDNWQPVDDVKVTFKPTADYWSAWSAREGKPSQNVEIPLDGDAKQDARVFRDAVPAGGMTLQQVKDAKKTHAIVFAHGYSVKEEDFHQSSDEVYRRMFFTGFRGQFVGFTWLADSDPIDWNNDPTDFPLIQKADLQRQVHNALLSANSLRHLLGQTLVGAGFQPDSINLFAHSLGNLIGWEALRLQQRANANQPLVQNFISAEAAVWKETFEPQDVLSYKPGAAGTPEYRAVAAADEKNYAVEEQIEHSWRFWFRQKDAAGQERNIRQALGGNLLHAFNPTDNALQFWMRESDDWLYDEGGFDQPFDDHSAHYFRDRLPLERPDGWQDPGRRMIVNHVDQDGNPEGRSLANLPALLSARTQEYEHHDINRALGTAPHVLATGPSDLNYNARDGGYSEKAHSDHTAAKMGQVWKWWSDFFAKGIPIGKV